MNNKTNTKKNETRIQKAKIKWKWAPTTREGRKGLKSWPDVRKRKDVLVILVRIEKVEKGTFTNDVT